MTEKLCALKTCQKPLVQRRGERDYNFKTRGFCGRSCVTRYRNSLQLGARRPTEPHPCQNPACGKMMHRGFDESIVRFKARKYCSPRCGTIMTNAERFREARERRAAREEQKVQRNVWQKRKDAYFKNQEPRPVLHPEIKTVEEFIARVGITKVPPAYCAVVTGATPIRREP
jgi:hypothetical protein